MAVDIVMLPTNCQVPPTPLNVIGKSVVTPLVVIVLVPDVAANVVTEVLPVHVIVGDSVRLPYIVLGVFVELKRLPENPVKSILLKVYVLPREIISVPAVMLKDTALASANVPVDNVLVPVAPLYVQ